ncbi:MAG: IMP dehydrogenase [Candidatus Dojkabacteria bacterium]
MHPKIHSHGITYDDVLLVPGYADFLRQDISLESKLSRNITLALPLVAAPMDTVAESKMCIALGKLGGIGIIHRNVPCDEQALHVKHAKQAQVQMGAAIGVSAGYQERVEALIDAGVDVIVIDSAHGYTKGVIEVLKYIKSHWNHVDVITGSIATYDGAKALIDAGADGLRVGMGPGAICTTRIVSGMGVPQITAILETVKAAEGSGVPIIADGGIKQSGDIVKAFAAGASTVMMGSYFAACEEAPGEICELTADEVPSRFKSITENWHHTNGDGERVYRFKSYRGMGSVGAMERGAQVRAEDEFHGNEINGQVLVAEGVEGMVPVKGAVADVVAQTVGGIRSGMFYAGTKTIAELQKNGTFYQITQASLVESHPHDILVTNSGKSYS